MRAILWSRINAALLLLVLLAVVGLFASRAYGGPLDPGGPPGPTGHSLDDIAPSWDSQLSSAGGCASLRFKCVLGGAAVLDRETGVVWETAPGLAPADWFTANAACNAATIGGRGGWRLPDVREFMSILDQTQSNPPLPAGHPFTVSSNAYWTSTELSASSGSASTINLGTFSLGSSAKGSVASVWCVRGAPVQGGGGAAATPVASPTAIGSDACTFGGAAVLAIGTLNGQTTNGCGVEASEPAPSCAPAGAHSRWYSISVPSGQFLSLTVAPDDSLFDPAVAVLTGSTLPSLAEAACANSAGAGATESASVTNATGAPIAYAVRVDSGSAGNAGPFGITASTGSPPPGCTFTTAIALSQGVTAGQTTVGGGKEGGEPAPSRAGRHALALVCDSGSFRLDVGTHRCSDQSGF